MCNDKDRIAILEAVVYSLKHEIDQYRKTNISIEQLKQLIIQYDYCFGRYPESDWEGLSVYSFICEKLGLEEDIDYYPYEKYITMRIKNNRWK